MKAIFVFIFVSLAHVSHQFPVPILEDRETDFALLETTASQDDAQQFQIVELPSEFNTYDMNKDGAISLDELSDITETHSDDAMLPFHNAGKNGKEVLMKQEFEDAAWVFSISEGIIL